MPYARADKSWAEFAFVAGVVARVGGTETPVRPMPMRTSAQALASLPSLQNHISVAIIIAGTGNSSEQL